MHANASNALPLAFALLICLAPAACGKIVTTKLAPEIVAQDCTSDDDHNSSACLTSCGLAVMGRACTGDNGPVPANSLKTFPAPADSMVVGWNDNYDDGTEPQWNPPPARSVW